jgi:diacylglycerol kinase (ATP)
MPEAPLVLFNPSAGMGRAGRGRERLTALLRAADFCHEFAVTESEEHLKELARRAAGAGRTIVGAGGDSTFHLIVNEIMAAAGKAPFGMIGLGSSNDIALEFGLEPVERAVEALRKGRVKNIDLGLISRAGSPLRVFLGQANIGLGAAVNDYVARLAGRRPLLARRQKLAGILGILDAYRKRRIPVALKIRSERETREGRFAAAVFSNTRFWATGKMIAPRARPDDGLLDACLIGKCSFPRLVRINALASKGRHERAREVRLLQAREITVSSPVPLSIQADGELLRPGGPGPIRFQAAARALHLIC